MKINKYLLISATLIIILSIFFSKNNTSSKNLNNKIITKEEIEKEFDKVEEIKKENQKKFRKKRKLFKEELNKEEKLTSSIIINSTKKTISDTIETNKTGINSSAKINNPNPLEAFRELNQIEKKGVDKKNVNNQRNFPLGFDDSNNINVIEQEESPNPSESEKPELNWAFGQARGYAMLYAMHPKAKRVVETQVQNLLDARIRETYLGVLIDGTFSKNYNYLKTVIKKLNSEKRTLTLSLYISNGPTMRKFDSTPIETDFSKINPIEFREKIKWNSEIRLQYRKLVEEANILFSYNKSLNRKNVNIAIPMLEDNLQRDSYFVMREIVQKNIYPNTIIIRNPCKGCFAGNDADKLDGQKEEHEVKYFDTLSQGDGFTFDGHGFNYPFKQFSFATSVNQTEKIMNLSLQRGLRYVGLWQYSWQGISDRNVAVHPDDRNYIVPTEKELEYEIEVLREGLSVEKTE